MANWADKNALPTALSGAGIAAFLPLSRLRLILQWLVGVALLSLLADVFWQVMPKPQTNSSLPSLLGNLQLSTQTKPSAQNTQTVDLATMQSWHLFGQAQQAAVVVEPEVKAVDNNAALEAKETRLQLKLLGVMVSSGDDSYAVLEHAGQSDTFKVGQAIPIGQGIVLSRVMADRVIIDNRGSLESLMLYDDSKGNPIVQVNRPAPPVSTGKKVVDQRSNAQVTQMADSYREQLMNNPMSMADVIRISIAKDSNGNVIGYSIRPGRDRKQFADFGLQAGDIVTSVNGVSLDDPAKAMELYGQLRTAREASLDIKRGSENINVLVGFSAP